MFDDNYFDPDLITNQDHEKLISMTEWLLNRVQDFANGRVESVNVYDGVTINSSYEDFCRGCHMGTINSSIKVPFDIFYSNSYAKDYIDKIENEKKEIERKEKEEKERKKVQARINQRKNLYRELKKEFEDE